MLFDYAIDIGEVNRFTYRPFTSKPHARSAFIDFGKTGEFWYDEVETNHGDVAPGVKLINKGIGVAFDNLDIAGRTTTSIFNLKPLSSPPPDPQIGDIYFNTTDESAYIYTSNGWESLRSR
jgi:hypothetical protein